MADVSYEQEIVEAVQRLDTEHQRRVLEFVKSLKSPKGISGKEFLERTRDIQIDPADLEIIARAIEEDCERIEPDEWEISS